MEAHLSQEYREFCKNRNIEIEYYTPKTYGKRNSRKSDTNTKKFGNSKYGRRKQSYRKCKPSITSNAIHRTPRTKKTPFELHHGRKPRTELTLLKTVKRIYLIGQNFLFQHQ